MALPENEISEGNLFLLMEQNAFYGTWSHIITLGIEGIKS